MDLLKVEHPILLAPMAGAMDWELAVEAAEGGACGSLPCAMLTPERMREQFGKIRERTRKPINFGFFCHTPPVPNNARENAWRERLKPYYEELAIDPAAPVRRAIACRSMRNFAPWLRNSSRRSSAFISACRSRA
jgi:nitronate monooxygenase